MSSRTMIGKSTKLDGHSPRHCPSLDNITNVPPASLGCEELFSLLQTPPPPGQPYSAIIPGSEDRELDRSAIYRHWRYANIPLLQTLDPQVQTLYDLFSLSAKRVPNANCLGKRKWNEVAGKWEAYEWMSYKEVEQRSRNFGAGICALYKEVGITQQKFGVGLWCPNRPEWQITDLGCTTQSFYTVSLYETLGPDTTEYIINKTSLASVVVSTAHISSLLRIAPRCPQLKIVILVDSSEDNEINRPTELSLLAESASKIGIKIHTMSSVETIGANSSIGIHKPNPSDIATINYTSGTTGDPKGVVLNHANAVAAASVARLICDITSSDILFSYLPLAHIYERVVEQSALMAGASIGYFHGDVAALADDMKALQPTGFNSVPRIYNRFGALLRKETNNNPVANGKMDPELVAELGLQKAKRMMSAAAPLDPDLQQLLRSAFRVEFIQGYGLTETYAIGMAQMGADSSTGNCGGVLPSGEACLQSVPDMGYLVTDTPRARGELLLRGTTLFHEYYGEPDATAKTIDHQGWFHTGDIAEVDELGRFRIVDRKKNVVKLAQGEYISPERIENVYLANCNLLAQAFVHGDPSQSFPVAILGVDPEPFAQFAGQRLGINLKADDMAAMKKAMSNERVVGALLELLHDIGKEKGLNSYERVRAVHLEIEPFTVFNELLTATFKLRRVQARNMFQKHLDRLYGDLSTKLISKARL